MPWKPADFKGSRVWIEVDGGGAPRLVGGRVPMRYSDRPGSKTYNAAPSNLRVDAAAPAVELGASEPASASPTGAAKGSGFGKAGTRTEAQKGLAADAARALIAGLGDTVAIAYTDGGCRGNPGPAGSGVRLELPGGRVAEACASLGRATNNVAELSAIGIALDLLDEAAWPSGAPAAVLTDSGYCHGVLCLRWKAKANAELIGELRARLAARPGVAIHWVAGHVGIAGNERADELANAGVDGLSRRRWIDP